MSDRVPASNKALKEALDLSETILKDMELDRLPLSRIALKARRVSRLLNDFDYESIFGYEVSGYPTTAEGMTPEVWKYAKISGRVFEQKDASTKETKEFAYRESIGQLEAELDSLQVALQSATDPDVSISSSNPNQFVSAPQGNVNERTRLRAEISAYSERLESRRMFIYNYILRWHYELKFSEVASDIFSRLRQSVDSLISKYLPESIRKFTAVYENLQSNNSEDWSNAVHSCRRIIEDLADRVFPPQEEDRVIRKDGNEKHIKLGEGNYINRLVCFVDDNSESKRFRHIVGSDLEYLGNRLDAIVESVHKGTHDEILDRKEADRYVIHTYMIVADILELLDEIDDVVN